ncbi:unnamed protein product [Ophioblennius macclurei]
MGSEADHVRIRHLEGHPENFLDESHSCNRLILSTKTRFSTNASRDVIEIPRHAPTGRPSALRTPGAFCTLLTNAKASAARHGVRFYHSKDSSKSTSSQTDAATANDEPADARLTHTDAQGRAAMVDVGGKAPTTRTASASATVLLGPAAFRLLRDNQLAKGDALAVAQLAGIMASKQTSALIPLCHPLPLDHAAVAFRLDERRHAAVVTATCRTTGRTGVEMEALTAASVAALTVYDMCKAVSHDIVITDVKLLSKTGGKKDFHRNLNQTD